MFGQLEFISKICNNLIYWGESHVLEMAIQRYHKFMILMREYPRKTLIPTLDIELIWRAHQTQATIYARYSFAIHRRLLEYNDKLPQRDFEEAYAKTFIHWSKHYKEPYASDPPAFMTWLKGHYRSSFLLPPVGLYRFSVWLKYHIPIKEKAKDVSGGKKPFLRNQRSLANRFRDDEDGKGNRLSSKSKTLKADDTDSVEESYRRYSIDSNINPDNSVFADHESSRRDSVDSITNAYNSYMTQPLGANDNDGNQTPTGVQISVEMSSLSNPSPKTIGPAISQPISRYRGELIKPASPTKMTVATTPSPIGKSKLRDTKAKDAKQTPKPKEKSPTPTRSHPAHSESSFRRPSPLRTPSPARRNPSLKSSIRNSSLETSSNSSKKAVSFFATADIIEIPYNRRGASSSSGRDTPRQNPSPLKAPIRDDDFGVSSE